MIGFSLVVFDGIARKKAGAKKRVQSLINQENPLSFMELNDLADILVYIESPSKCISSFSNIFLLLRKYCQFRPMSAGEKTGTNFRVIKLAQDWI